MFTRPRPLYVVAGFQRSGTTMMMRAFEAGGLKVGRAPVGEPGHDYYELSRDVRSDVWGYDPDGNGTLRNWLAPYVGKAVKLLTGMVAYTPEQPHGIVCVFMRRPLEEIQASGDREFGVRWQRASMERSIEQEIARWRGRSDTRFIELWYGDVLNDPIGTMERLKEHGFPINTKKAARIIDPSRPQTQLSAVVA